jgi:hypothetical protein
MGSSKRAKAPGRGDPVKDNLCRRHIAVKRCFHNGGDNVPKTF